MPNDRHKSWLGGAMSAWNRQVPDLINNLFGHNLLSQAIKQLTIDPYRGMLLEVMSHGYGSPLQTGIIVYALPHAHWYKVQLDGVRAQIGCTTIDNTSHVPTGVRSVGSLPPRSHVVVWVPPGRTYGLILGSYAVPHQDAKLIVPDYSVQGGQAGMQREDAYKNPIKQAWREGHILDFSAARPLDSINCEWGRITETGIEFLMDPYQIFMRVNEACGLWFNYIDSHARFAGIQMDVQSAVHEIIARLDEGENRYTHYDSTYPWEALGMYDSGSPVHEVFDDTKVQYSIPKGKYDLKDGEEDLQSIARYQEHGGYLGQGRLRTVTVPCPIDSGKRFYSDSGIELPDFGVWRESIGLDGSYLNESAKQILLLKRVLIPVAKEMRLPEDQKTGDDARQGNYKFSGTFGGGPDHKIGDVTLDGDNKHLLSVSAVDDLISYATNWQAIHPFHYHQKDYTLPDEADLNKLGPKRVQDKLSFGDLSSQLYMKYPSAVPVKVDARYGEVDYFQREAGICLLPDGGICIFDGYGAQIVLTAGNIRFECPGNVFNFAGRSIVNLAGKDIIERAKSSVDISASENDVRIKAEHNMMIFGGNDTDGGILLESRAPGFVVDFDGKTGEDVVMGGILLKSPKAGVVCWGGDIYLRTGGGDSKSGIIVLDADSGGQPVIVNSQLFSVFTEDGANLYAGDPKAAGSKVFVFSQDGTILDGQTVLGGDVVSLGAIVVQGAVAATQGFAAGQGSPFVGDLKNSDVAGVFSAAQQAITAGEQAGTTKYKDTFTDFLYAEKEPGNDAVIKQAHFNFRDDKDHSQYGTIDFKLPESRWQMMSRLGLGTGGSGWKEKSVQYQGQPQQPWPGKTNWEGSTLLEASFSMFDVSTGQSKARPGPYEKPEVQDFKMGTPSSDFKVIT